MFEIFDTVDDLVIEMADGVQLLLKNGDKKDLRQYKSLVRASQFLFSLAKNPKDIELFSES